VLEATGMIVLAVNVGSSSIKLSLHDITAEISSDRSGDRLGAGAVVRAAPAPPLWELNHPAPFTDLPALIATAWTSHDSPIKRAEDVRAVGHRIVHGGASLRESVIITPSVIDVIGRAGVFAPAHNALELAAVAAAEKLLDSAVAQVAVFDTSFHRTLSPAAYTYAGPYEWLAAGIRRFGFHGISHSYAAPRAATMLGRDVRAMRIVSCHLGSGSSLAAIRNNESVDTTMGFTPLDGLVMATRSGSVDPGILLHLLRGGMTLDTLDRTLQKQSGLAGLSGRSGDMQELLEAINTGDERAALALDVYVHRLRQDIGAMTATLGGIDALVFTGGVGEHAAPVRQRAVDVFQFLGVEMDATANAAATGDAIVSSARSHVPVVVVEAQENLVIAEETVRVALATGAIA
jgi:acetate kinase